MARPKHTRRGADGARPHRSRSKVRATRFSDGSVKRKKSKEAKRRYEHGGAHGPGKLRKKRRKSSKKRRKLRFTIRYDKPAHMRNRRRRLTARPGRSASRAPRPLAPTAAPALTPEVAALTATITSRAHRALAPRPPIVPRTLAPRAAAAPPLARVIVPKQPPDLAARAARQAAKPAA